MDGGDGRVRRTDRVQTWTRGEQRVIETWPSRKPTGVRSAAPLFFRLLQPATPAAPPGDALPDLPPPPCQQSHPRLCRSTHPSLRRPVRPLPVIYSLLHRPASSGDQLAEAVLPSPVRCVAVDDTFTYLASCGDDKLLSLWRIDSLQLINQRYFLRFSPVPFSLYLQRTTKTSDSYRVHKTSAGNRRLGQVWRRIQVYLHHLCSTISPSHLFSYPLEYTPLSEKQKRDALSSHENPSDGTLILGHTSVLTSFLLTKDERYIITADRDEHIRVSWYPKGFVVEMYCLGHEK